MSRGERRRLAKTLETERRSALIYTRALVLSVTTALMPHYNFNGTIIYMAYDTNILTGAAAPHRSCYIY